MDRVMHLMAGMATARKFQELDCWQLARELRTTVSQLLQTPKLKRDFDLCDQLRRSTRSATGNIAEGFPCTSNIECARFFEFAIRSLCEAEDRLIEAVDQGYLTKEEVAPALNLVKRASIATRRFRATRL
jgi:four helix bundle protein